MALPEFARRLIEINLDQYCDERVPEVAKVQVQMTYKIRENNVTLYERCRSYLDLDQWVEVPIAQFRYDSKSAKWTLYSADRNSQWHIYGEIPPDTDFIVLLEEVDRWINVP